MTCVVMHAFIPSTWEVEIGGSQVNIPRLTGIYRKFEDLLSYIARFLSHKEKKKCRILAPEFLAGRAAR